MDLALIIHTILAIFRAYYKPKVAILIDIAINLRAYYYTVVCLGL